MRCVVVREQKVEAVQPSQKLSRVLESGKNQASEMKHQLSADCVRELHVFASTCTGLTPPISFVLNSLLAFVGPLTALHPRTHYDH